MKSNRSIAVVITCVMAMIGMSLAATAAEPMKNVQIGGKVIAQSAMKDGKSVKSYSLEVTSAKGADGKAIAGLIGKTLSLGGAKAAQLDKDANQHVLVRGTLSGDQGSLDVDSFTGKITPKKTTPRPAPKASPASMHSSTAHASAAHK